MGLIVFLLVLLGFWLLYRYWPNILLYILRNQIKRSQQQQAAAFRQAQERMCQQAREQARRNRRSRKKIDPSVGEYVEFEEIETASSTTYSDGTTRVDYTREEQITDVEWEEL